MRAACTVSSESKSACASHGRCGSDSALAARRRGCAERLLVLLQVLVVGERQALDHRQQGRVVAKHAVRLAAARGGWSPVTRLAAPAPPAHAFPRSSS